MFSSPLACALALLAAAVTAAPSADEITKLPGWNGTLPSKVSSMNAWNVAETAGPRGQNSL